MTRLKKSAGDGDRGMTMTEGSTDMDASRPRPERSDADAERRARQSEINAEAIAQDFLEPKDYVLAEPSAMTELRETIDDFTFQIEVLKVRVSAINEQAVRLGKSTIDWADGSAHEQLGSYPWAKLAGAFAATFVATRILRMLPLGSIGSVAVPLLLRAREQR
jgi:hypothetical protein